MKRGRGEEKFDICVYLTNFATGLRFVTNLWNCHTFGPCSELLLSFASRTYFSKTAHWIFTKFKL